VTCTESTPPAVYVVRLPPSGEATRTRSAVALSCAEPNLPAAEIMHESSATEAVHRSKRMRSGSYTKDDKGLSSCIPRPPAGISMNIGMAASVPVSAATTAATAQSWHVPHYTGPHATGVRMDTDVYADKAEAVVEAFVHETTGASSSPPPSSESDGADEEHSSCSSGSECDTTELFNPGELARSCTFDEACRMLLESVPDVGDDEANDGPCALDW